MTSEILPGDKVGGLGNFCPVRAKRGLSDLGVKV